MGLDVGNSTSDKDVWIMISWFDFLLLCVAAFVGGLPASLIASYLKRRRLEKIRKMQLEIEWIRWKKMVE